MLVSTPASKTRFRSNNKKLREENNTQNNL